MEPKGLDLVFRCASAEGEFPTLQGLAQLRSTAIDSGVTLPATPGGGKVVHNDNALLFVLQHSDLASDEYAGLSVLANLHGQVAAPARDMSSRGKLPQLISSKPPTPQHRLPLTNDDVLSDNSLPPITVYDSGRPGSRQYEYRRKPTGEGLARLFAARDLDQRVGLQLLHDAAVSIKRSQPHRLVKFPAGGVQSKRKPRPLPPIRADQHVDAASLDGEAYQNSRQKAHNGVVAGRPHRLPTARRIDRKLEDLAAQLQHLQVIRAIRQAQNVSAHPDSPRKSAENSSMTGTSRSVMGTKNTPSSKAQRRPPKAPSTAVSTLAGTLTTRPPTSIVDAIISSRNAPRQQHVAAPPVDAPPPTRAPVIPHRGLRASSPAKPQLSTKGPGSLTATLL